MIWKHCARIALLGCGLVAAGCNNNDVGGNSRAAASAKSKTQPATSSSHVVKINPGANVQEETQTALIKAKPGSVIEFAEGTFEFTMGLSLVVEGVTIR